MENDTYKHLPPQEVRDLGLFETRHHDELNVKALDAWRFSRALNELECCYTLEGHPVTMTDEDDDEVMLPYWVLRIKRPTVDHAPNGAPLSRARATKTFVATVCFVPLGHNKRDVDSIPRQTVLVGRCEGWTDAVRKVAEEAPLIDHMRETAVKVYGAHNAGEWAMVRPFKVKWVFRNVNEPNARYSEFELVGEWGFDPVSDGAVACCYAVTPEAARKLAIQAGANAFLLTVTRDGRKSHQLWHRASMTMMDPWDIDDWRARVIAGTKDV